MCALIVSVVAPAFWGTFGPRSWDERGACVVAARESV
jgi:hypothetical protein